jgi:hypothetical protein
MVGKPEDEGSPKPVYPGALRMARNRHEIETATRNESGIRQEDVANVL